MQPGPQVPSPLNWWPWPWLVARPSTSSPFFAKYHQKVTGYEVRVEADQAERPPQVFTSVKIHHVVTGYEIDPVAIEEAMRLSEEKYCAVGAMVKQTAALHTTYEIVEEKISWLAATPVAVET